MCLWGFGSAHAAREDGTSWKFVVFGNTRDATKETLTGISPYLSALATGIAAEKPDFVIHTGDLINGYYTHSSSPVHGKFEKMFENWKSEVKPIFEYANGRGIPIYVVRGNHEDGELITNLHLKKAYLDVFGHLMPQNGPENEKGLTYSFAHRQTKFIGTDQYRGFDLLVKGKVNQAWLDDQLTQNPRPFVFVFGHTPAYKVAVAGISVSPPPLLYNHTSDRDKFWTSLKDHKVALYFCGHVHFYCRVTRDDVQQVLIGNGGANMVDFDPSQVDPAVTLNYPVNKVKGEDMKTGYLLVTVDEDSFTIRAVQKLWNIRTGQWEPGDQFTIRVR